MIHKMVNEFEPKVVIIDPISNFSSAGSALDARGDAAAPDRLPEVAPDHRHVREPHQRAATRWERTDVGISSLIDTWILLRDIELAGERNRGLYVLKSRGMKHSNQIREYLITSEGIELAGRLRRSGRRAHRLDARRPGRRARRPRRLRADRRSSASSATSRASAPRWKRRSRRCAASSRRSRTNPSAWPSRTGAREQQLVNDRSAAALAPRRRRSKKESQMNTRKNGSPVDSDKLGAAPVHRRPDAQVARRDQEPEEGLRRAPRRALRDRDHRPAEEPAPREGRPDRRHPDAGAQAARAAAQDHRRPFRHRAHAGRACS